MNNGVETNQNNINEQPVLTPIADSTVVATTPVVTPLPVAPQEAAPAAPVPVAPAPVVVAPATPEAAPTPVAPVADPSAAVVPTIDPLALTGANTDASGATVPASMDLSSMKVNPEIEEKKKKKKEKVKKVKEENPDAPVKQKKSSFSIVFLFIIFVMGAYIYYLNGNQEKALSELKYKCSPVNETKEEIKLDINSTLVQDLYSKVYTSIREDYAQPEWNDTMKLYLAFRQISDHEMYDSNCNMFTTGKMEPYTCEVSTNFVPKAFRTSTLYLEWKKLYGEGSKMPLINVKLQNACIGGYEYIKERDEFVQGYCKEPTATSFRVKKTLTEAISSRNTIILVEEVQYAGNEKLDLPSYLRSGTYYYTFRLDMNYNYVLLAKTYNEKYQ